MVNRKNTLHFLRKPPLTKIDLETDDFVSEIDIRHHNSSISIPPPATFQSLRGKESFTKHFTNYNMLNQHLYEEFSCVATYIDLCTNETCQFMVDTIKSLTSMCTTTKFFLV